MAYRILPAIGRRTLIKGGAALGALQVASPYIISARGEVPREVAGFVETAFRLR
jgi:hypothetical protein